MPPRQRSSTRLCVSGQTVVFFPPEVAMGSEGLMIGTRAVKEALERLPPTVQVVAFVGSSSPPAKEELDAMAADMEGGWDAVVSARPVSEAVKVVEGDWVEGSLDRSGLVSITPPVLVDRGMLSGILLAPATQAWIDPIEEVIDGGGKVRLRS